MTERLNRRIFTKALVAGAGGLAIDRLSGPAIAAGNVDPADKAEAELKQAKQHLKRTSERVAKHVARKLVKVSEMVGEPTVEMDHGTLFLTAPKDEMVPDLWFAYFDDKNAFTLYEGSRHSKTNGGPDSFYGQFYLPDNGNIIHGKIAAGQPETVTAEDVRDVVMGADFKTSGVTVSTHLSDKTRSIYFQRHAAPLYVELQDAIVRPATADEINHVAGAIRRVDHSPALSLSAPGNV